MAGPSEGDIGQAALLAQAVAPQGLLVGGHGLSQKGLVRDGGVETTDGEGRQVVGIGPQGEREGRGAAHPPRLHYAQVDLGTAGVGGEDLFNHAGHGDDIPLQALGGVDGEELDRPGRGVDLGSAHGVLVLLGGVEPLQEACERGRVGVRGEGEGRLLEGVEGAVPHRVADSGGDLDVKVEGLLGQGDKVGKGQGDGLADAPDRPGGAQGDGEPRRRQLDGGRQVLRPLLVPSQQGVQGFADQWRVGLVLGASALRSGPARLRGRADDLTGQRRQGAQVAGADAETGQKPDHPVPARGVGGDGQQGADVGDLGDVQHPAQAHDRVGHTGRLQLGGDGLHLRPGAAQDGHLGAGRPALGEEAGDGTGLLDGILEKGSVHRARLQAEGDGPGPQGRDGDVLPHRIPVLDDAGAQGRRDGIGGLEDSGVIAPGGRQLQDGGGVGRRFPGGEAGGSGGVEALVEGVQRSGARPAPPVDGLMRVADGGHPGVGEERGQEADLGDRGVLELVQQDGGVLGSYLGGRLGDGLGDGAGQGDLVAEVEQTVAALVALQLGDDVEQGLPLGHDGRCLADQCLAALDGGQGRELLV